jgi:hypothetical protein
MVELIEVQAGAHLGAKKLECPIPVTLELSVVEVGE